jgi:CDGSH-type Zn-finger protein
MSASVDHYKRESTDNLHQQVRGITMTNKAPQINCLPNGPYLFKNGSGPTVQLTIEKPDQNTTEDITQGALCRCGASKNKPYCDGSHTNIGFTDTNEANHLLNKYDSYAGKQITIHDNRSICAHAGHCTNNLSTVFKMGEEPWINSDGATADAIIDVIKSCPSGALSYSIDEVEHKNQHSTSTITVIKDGPYAILGAIDLLGVPASEGKADQCYTLCRCGASKNKPFCDGSHWSTNFKDPID